MVRKIQKFIIRHKVEFTLLIIIIIAASFLRLYRISDYMTFLGDEGRDAIVAKDILRGQLTLLGPRASAGDFFLGPVYYYMMAPFLFLSNLDPVGPAVMVALFGIATVFLVYFVGRKFFGVKAGLMAASLYAVSPLVIAYSRSSWNPNPMPFFSLLMLYLLFSGVTNNNKKLFFIVGLLLGISMQLHYLSTFLAVIVFFFVLAGNFIVAGKNFLSRIFFQYLYIFIGFIIGFLPFLAFEARHGFPNTKTILRFVFEDNTTKAYIPHHSFIGNILDVFFRIFGRLVTKFPPPEQVNVSQHSDLFILQIATVILAFAAIGALFFVKDKMKVLLLSLWLFFGVFLFGIYKQAIYDYYFGFMFPLPFLLVGNLLSVLGTKVKANKIGTAFGLIIFIILLLLNLSGNPFQFTPNKQKDQAKRIAEFVLSKTDNKPFNFALLTQGNSDHAYRYFFEVENKAPVTILNPIMDPKRTSVTDQLLVVCEKQDCQPLGNSLWEVAGFGRAEITGEWDIPFVKVYRLVHYAP